MRGAIRIAAAGLLLAMASQAGAQEINCRQNFMNDSEDAICASEELLRLDLEMAQAYRRAEPHMTKAKSEQRVFRRALKSCKGDMPCLVRSYEARNDELRGFINTLPEATDVEAEQLGRAFDEFGAARYAEGVARAQAAAIEDARLAAELEVQAGNEALAKAEAERQELVRDAKEREDTEAAAVLQEQQRAEMKAQDLARSVQPKREPEGSIWGAVGLLAFLLLVVLGIILAIWEAIKTAVDRCPQCTKWFAGEVIDQDREAYTDYKTVNRTETTRDRSGVARGSRDYKEQVAVRVVKVASYLRCKECKYEWVRHTKSESS